MRTTYAIKTSKAHAKAEPQAEQTLEEKRELELAPVWRSLALGQGGIQQKLAVSHRDDACEQEADRIADRVMQTTTSPLHPHENDFTSRPSPGARRTTNRNHDDKIQPPRNSHSPRTFSSNDATYQGPGRPLDAPTRKFFEERFGHDFSNVSIHTNHQSSDQAQQLSAHAFTVGSHIVFNRDRFQPNTAGGRRLLAHELAHVIQQRPARSVGGLALSRAPARQIQRQPFVRGPAEAPRTPAQIRAMTLSDFNSLATRQLDWFASPSLTAPAAAGDMALFRQILDFGREQPSILTTCGSMVVNDLIIEGVPAVFDPLRVYARGAATSARTTAWLRTTNVVHTAVTWANHLLTIEAASDPATLRVAMPPPDPIADPSGFEQLVTNAYVADFANYLTTVHPVLSATDGWEVYSYVLLRGEGADPVSYVGRIHLVRDYHHFKRDALDRLVTNEAVTTAQQQQPATRRPLTLVLHTTMDHNHAFHRTDGMTALILDSRILTIVLEGFATLAAYQAELPGIAARYGIGGRISQVLIAGHGDFGSVGLAGTVAAGVVHEEPLTNTGTAAEVANTENLIRTLVGLMDTDPRLRRIALAACLTASHTVTTPIDPNNPATAAAQIRNAITTNPNIRDFIAGLAGAGSTVIGVRASQPATTFLDPTGRLALNVPDDPRIMGSIIEYVEFGTEPHGAVRAVLEGWANDHASAPAGTLTRDAMTRRIGRPMDGQGWYEQVIRGVYDAILNHYWTNGQMINWLNGFAGFVAHFIWTTPNEATNLWTWVTNLNFTAAVVDAIFTPLPTSAVWTSQRRIRLLVNQVWMRYMPAPAPHAADFLTDLGQYTTCGEASGSIDIAFVRPSIGTLLTIPPPAVPDPGQLRLAIMEAAVNPLPSPAPAILPPHVQFLRALLGAGPNFPAALNIDSVAAGVTNEDTILAAIGRSPAGAPPPAAGPVLVADRPRANVDLNRDGTNDFYLERFSRSGIVANCRFLHVRSRPWMGDNIRDVIAAAAPVRIVGQFRDWYGIEHRGRIRFVHSRFIQLAP